MRSGFSQTGCAAASEPIVGGRGRVSNQTPARHPIARWRIHKPTRRLNAFSPLGIFRFSLLYHQRRRDVADLDGVAGFRIPEAVEKNASPMTAPTKKNK